MIRATLAMLAMLAIALGLGLSASIALAQDKPTLAGYLQQGYDVIHVEGGGGQFVFFILRKERTLVHCSVLLQSGETSSCRILK